MRKELKKNYVYKDNKGRIGNYFLPACSDQIAAIDKAIAKHVGTLPSNFFEDIQAFNMSFSRTASTDEEDDAT